MPEDNINARLNQEQDKASKLWAKITDMELALAKAKDEWKKSVATVLELEKLSRFASGETD